MVAARELAELAFEVDRVQLLEGFGSNGGDRAGRDGVRFRDARAGDGDLFQRILRHGGRGDGEYGDTRQDLGDGALHDHVV